MNRYLQALFQQLANIYSGRQRPDSARLAEVLREKIAELRQARTVLSAEVEKHLPQYAALINPKPTTVEDARSTLRPGEVLIATYVGAKQSYVWAVPYQGQLAFSTADLGRAELEEKVMLLRAALDPHAATLGDIPEFDVAVAYGLYEKLLKPVEAGWKGARSLLVVARGPLGYLPLSVLPAAPAKLSPEGGALFTNYRNVPWLTRGHSITMLPSVASLTALRGLRPGGPEGNAFVGFADPWFSETQAAEVRQKDARTRQMAELATGSLETRRFPVGLRAAPNTTELDSAELAKLPRLPDTADEMRGIALALNADPATTVFIGAAANEDRVKSMDLSRTRVIAFATHGLMPGDLNGLTQPALALSSPQLTGSIGDGLLTMDEILGLRLNADWIVLSACNTGSGAGAGAEAVSGLGRAFFYAGARALLVSNWPVETTSAKTLTTDLFRRQAEDGTLTRTQALRQAMLAMVDEGGYVDTETGKMVFSYAHLIFWAPFTIVGDGGGGQPAS